MKLSKDMKRNIPAAMVYIAMMLTTPTFFALFAGTLCVITLAYFAQAVWYAYKEYEQE